MKPHKPGDTPVMLASPHLFTLPRITFYSSLTPSSPVSPGFGNGNGLGAGAFPGTAAHPGEVGEEGRHEGILLGQIWEGTLPGSSLAELVTQWRQKEGL